MIVDKQGRRFRSLRVSLTAACNYACNYCVANGQRLLKASNELSADQLIAAVGYLIEAAGIDKVRITGGEPLVTDKFDPFLAAVMKLPLQDVSLTTNGQFLKEKRDVIVDAGIQRINISLDSLNPLRFRQIASGGDLASVLEGIDLMLEAGLRVKLNMVPLRSQNSGDIVPLLQYSLERGIELRYIELMRMGHLVNNAAFQADFFPRESILDMIREHYEFERTDAPFDSTSVRYEIPGKGFFGIIANESAPFCSSCTRLRLSSDGYLYGCISNNNRHFIGDLLDLPRHRGLPALQDMLVNALGDKQDAFKGEVTVMKLIGG